MLKYAGIIKRRTEDYNLFIKDDGSDYAKVWSDFRQGLIKDAVSLREPGSTEVYKFNALGRDFIFKIDRGYPKHLDSKLWRLLQGPFYSTQMKVINKAVNEGCNGTADFYLVAEKRGGLISRESHILMECLPGRPLAKEADYTPFYGEIIALIRHLHRHRMALCDVNPHNFFITGQGLKAIDLSWRGAFWTGKAKDAMFLKQRYGIDLPPDGPLDRLAVLYVAFLHKARYALRALRKSLKGKK